MNNYEKLIHLINDWVNEQEFWKSDLNDWEGIFVTLSEQGFTFPQSCEIIEQTMNLTRAEYGG